MRLVILALMVLVFSDFNKCSNKSGMDFLGCWMDSREENKAETDSNIYRPCDFKEFPPSRFRFSFELLENGDCLWFRLDPADAHSMEKGTWTFDVQTRILEVRDLQKKIVKKYLVVDFSDQMLTLKII